MVNARHRKKAGLAFFCESPRHFDFVYRESNTSKCVKCEFEMFRLQDIQMSLVKK